MAKIGSKAKHKLRKRLTGKKIERRLLLIEKIKTAKRLRRLNNK